MALATSLPHTIYTTASIKEDESKTPQSIDSVSGSWAHVSVCTPTSQNSHSHASVFIDPLSVLNAPNLLKSNFQNQSSDSSKLLNNSSELLAEWYTSDLRHWQSEADLPQRRLMVQRIIAMTRINAMQRTNGLASGRTPSLAKRIELSLYSRAASFEEYCDLNSLRRRLQSLVCSSFREAAATKRKQHRKVLNILGKRKGSHSIRSFGNYKKRRTIGTRELATNAHANLTLFSLHEDLLRGIFSYLTGVETIQCRKVCQYAADVLPGCVYSLDVEIYQLQRAFTRHSTDILQPFTNLTRLNVSNRDKQTEAVAWNVSDIDSDREQLSEIIVLQLAEALERGGGRMLRELGLISTFNNTYQINGLHALCRVLTRGKCPHLQKLLMSGNNISDFGTVDIAWLLNSRISTQLTRLDIGRNFIGEIGVKRIMTALAGKRCKQLMYLDMSGNIISDNCVPSITKVLANGSCPRMKFLGLEDNFLSALGVESIVRAVHRRRPQGVSKI
ncbi:unnamed protein product [Albugo candida]|uniref:F-box domain-containing protein n=1 Tax=Albugo candida TaxID=65357 RepID=A0A024GHE5_9STRA|nr:unnamed protein product [Albugo candida]|eukprot:CCI45891.1 unnamed protein product [Albugo candida]